jgi:inner membrane protein
MLLLSHVGITLAAAALVKKAFASRATSQDEVEPAEYTAEFYGPPPVSSPKPGRARLIDSIDWRLVIVGSMLPDIIDKPIGTAIFAHTFENGRIFAHTLLFGVVLLVAGLYLYYHREWVGLLVVALCSMFHLVLDQMWREPRTLLWPFMGWAFPRYDVSDWLSRAIDELQTDPITYVPEIIGTIIVVSLLIYLLFKGRVLSFIKTGRIAPEQ